MEISTPLRVIGTPVMIWNIKKNLIALRSVIRSATMLAAVLLISSVSAAPRALTLEQKLERKVTVTWQGQQLALALERLTSMGQITLWLDRRVDRQQTVAAQFVDIPLAQVLEKIAQQHSLGFAQLEKIVYIGPQQSAQEVSTLVHQVRNQLSELPASARKRWLRARATFWPRLSEPRSLAQLWLREANAQLVGGEQIPHDLWPEQSLPQLPLTDRLVLLLAGFDLTCQIATNGKSCEIVPISRPLNLARRRSAPNTSVPQTRVQPKSRGSSRQVFTLRLKNQPLGQVLDHFALQLQLEVVWATDRNLAREQLVSCDLQNVELDELLRNVLSPAGLQHQREGKRVTIQNMDKRPNN